MNYQQMITKSNVRTENKSRGGRTDQVITALRAHGIGAYTVHMLRNVKPRTAKRWAGRLVREGLESK